MKNEDINNLFEPLIRSEKLHDWCWSFFDQKTFCDCCHKEFFLPELISMTKEQSVFLQIEECLERFDE